MDTLLAELKQLGLNVSPAFNQGVVRSTDNADWFVGQEFEVDGQTVRLAWFGSWRDKKKNGHWRSTLVEEMSLDARAAIDLKVNEALKQQRADRMKFWDTVAVEASTDWENATDRGDHPYLSKKKLRGLYGARIMINDAGHPVMLVPMRDENEKLWNLTRIFTKEFVDEKTGQKRGNKFTLKGGRKEGTFHILNGDLKREYKYVFLSEGFATAASILESMADDAECAKRWAGQSAIVACFDAGNLLLVAKALRKRYPSAEFFICADNDCWKPEAGNAGVEAAVATATEVGGIALFPQFKNTKTLPTDFNDLACLEGRPAVAAQILNPTPLANAPETKPAKRGEQKIAQELRESFGDRIIKQKKDVFIYSEAEGRWVWYQPQEAFDHFMRLLDAAYGAGMKYKDLVSMYNRFFTLIPHVPPDRNMLAPPPYVTNFRNGALELLPKPDGTFGLEFREKRMSDLLIYSHPFDYRPEASPNEEFEATVSRVLPPEAVGTYYEILGACLMPAFPKVTFFTGKPGSGKSTLILFANQLIDPALRCSVDPSDWRGFGMETMAGKLVNLNTDIALSRPIAENILKQIEDRVPQRIQRKGIADVYAPLPAMHLFGANGLPKTVESVEAFTRRVVILRCDKYTAPDTGFIRDFANHVWKQNPQGVILRAIEGLKRLAANKGHFTQFESAKAEMKQWREDTADYVERFINELREGEAELDDSESKASLAEKGQISRKHFLIAFHSWFKVHAPQRTPPDAGEVYRRLRELGINEKKIKGVRYFTGFGVKETPVSAF